MSRLIESDIEPIFNGMERCDDEFISQTGKSMLTLCKEVVNLKDDDVNKKTAIISITSGLGIIGGFAQSIQTILSYYGINAFVTNGTDVTGYRQAYEENSDIVFEADDDNYLAFSMYKKAMSENGYATGTAFAAALSECIKNDKVKIADILVLGAGPVGTSAAKFLLRKGYNVKIFDIDIKKSECVCEKLSSCFDKNKIEMLQEKPEYIKYNYIFDATTAKNFIKETDVTRKTVIAAPGMPIGVTQGARECAKVIHNPLELGTIMMYCDCLAKMKMEGI